jgi:hypothetical protein
VTTLSGQYRAAVSQGYVCPAHPGWRVGTRNEAALFDGSLSREAQSASAWPQRTLRQQVRFEPVEAT